MQQCKLRAGIKGAHIHQPMAWPVPHTCAQLFRPYWGSSVQCTCSRRANERGKPMSQRPFTAVANAKHYFVLLFFFLCYLTIHYYCYIDSRFLYAPGTIAHGSIRLKPRSLASSLVINQQACADPD